MSKVQLNDGRIGVVSKQNKDIGDRPKIEVTSEESELEEVHFLSNEIDLSKESHITITKCFAG